MGSPESKSRNINQISRNKVAETLTKMVAIQDVVCAFRPRTNRKFGRKTGKTIIKSALWSKLEGDITKQLAHMRKLRKSEFHTGDRVASPVYERVMLSEAERFRKLIDKLEKRTNNPSICENQRRELGEILSGMLTDCEVFNFFIRC